jgi:hypothetical protein
MLASRTTTVELSPVIAKLPVVLVTVILRSFQLILSSAVNSTVTVKRPGATLSTCGDVPSAKHHNSPAPVALASSQLFKTAFVPAKISTGNVRLSTEPFALLYALKIAAVLVSLMFPNVRLSLAWLGLLPHNLRVITPDWEACVLVGHVGAIKLRLVGAILGNVVAMIR